MSFVKYGLKNYLAPSKMTNATRMMCSVELISRDSRGIYIYIYIYIAKYDDAISLVGNKDDIAMKLR
jgi:hypothetical protein